MNLNNNEELIKFLNILLKNEFINQNAYKIITFFIITRNYGLINLKDNIVNICYKDHLETVISKAIRDGFNQDNIPYTNENILKLLINNYHENGFYFHVFNANNLNDILSSGLTRSSEKLNKIIEKYHLTKYFEKYNKIIVTDYLNSEIISKQTTFPPLNQIKEIMKNSKNFIIDDYYIIEEYYNKSTIDNNIGIALIERKKSNDYFGKYIDLSILNELIIFTKSCHMSDYDIIHFITTTISHNMLDTSKNIPSNLLSIISYKLNEKELENSRTR